MAEDPAAPPRPELKERQFELEFTAPDGTTGAVNALEFPDVFAAMLRAVRMSAEYLAGSKLEARYNLVSLHYNSPLTAVVEATGSVTDKVIAEATTFVGDVVSRVERGVDIPAHLPGPLVRALHHAASASRRSRLAVAVRSRTTRAVIRPQAADRFDLLFNDDVEIDGTVEGQLQVMSVRDRPSIRIWPKVGPPVSGRLPRKLIPKAKAAIDEYVIVEGMLIYYPNENHPRRIRVRDIITMDRYENDPRFEDLWGAGRDFRPEASSLQLIEEMRGGWE